MPVDDLPPGFQIIGALILITQIIGMLPNVAGENGRAFHGGNIHQRIILIGRAGDRQFAILTDDQPGPARTELLEAGILELCLEIIETAEYGVDARLPVGVPPPLGDMTFQ